MLSKETKDSLSPLLEFEHLIRMMDAVRTFYLSYESDTSRKIIETLQTYKDAIDEPDDMTSFLFAGSVGFGQATQETTDVDFVYITRHPSTFKRQKSHMIIPALQSHGLPVRGLDFDVVDLEAVEAFIQNKETRIPYQPHIIGKYHASTLAYEYTRFMTFYGLTRHVDTTFDSLFQRGLALQDSEVDKRMANLTLDDNYIGVRYSDLSNSFQKYHQRLAQRNIVIPQEILALEKTLLGQDR